jgi:excisionase family DNA binding protein
LDRDKLEASDRLYTPAEVARSLRVSAATISRVIHSGKLKAYRVGNQWRIAASDLRSYIEAETNGAMAERNGKGGGEPPAK